MAPKEKIIRETDDEARTLARKLMRGSSIASIAVHDPETQFPNCSRVLLGTASDGTPVILASRLSGHTRAILADNRVGILAGEPGKGDPLAWPRLSLQCKAEAVERESEDHTHIRDRFIRRHKKAALYVDFPDFLFFRLIPVTASLNGGFGKAYQLDSQDLAIASSAVVHIGNIEKAILDGYAAKYRDKNSGANTASKATPALCGVDAEGADFLTKQGLKREIFIPTIDAPIDASAVITQIFGMTEKVI